MQTQHSAKNLNFGTNILWLSLIFVTTTLGIVLAMIPLGGFTAEFGGADEAAHLVSGIMVRQYLVEGLIQGVPPMQYAQNYYAHYPKVAIGHWPPLFYLMEAVWFLLTGLSRYSITILAACLAGVFACLTAWICRLHEVHWPLAAAAGLAAAFMPQTLASTLEFSSDPATAILSLIAALACQRWLNSLEWRHGIQFALIAAVAALFKGNAFPIFLLPVLVLLRPAPWASLLRPAFWLPLMLLVVLTLPWYAAFRQIVVAEIVPGASRLIPWRLFYSAEKNLRNLFLLAGPLAFLLYLISLLPSWGHGWAKRSPVLAALPLAIWLFLSFISPHTDARLMLAATPVICLGTALALRRLPIALACAVFAAGLALAYGYQGVPAKPANGWVPAAAWLHTQPPRTYFIVSNQYGEGPAISESAILDPAPRSTLLRATKLLQKGNWMGGNIRYLVNSPEEVLAVLDQHQVDAVLLQIDPRLPTSPPWLFTRQATSTWPVAARFENIEVRLRPVVADPSPLP